MNIDVVVCLWDCEMCASRLRALLHNWRKTSSDRLAHWSCWRWTFVSHHTWPSTWHHILLQGRRSQQGWLWTTVANRDISLSSWLVLLLLWPSSLCFHLGWLDYLLAELLKKFWNWDCRLLTIIYYCAIMVRPEWMNEWKRWLIVLMS